MWRKRVLGPASYFMQVTIRVEIANKKNQPHNNQAKGDHCKTKGPRESSTEEKHAHEENSDQAL